MMTHPFLTITVARQSNQERLEGASRDRLVAEAAGTRARGVRAALLGALRADASATIGIVVMAGSVLVSQLV